MKDIVQIKSPLIESPIFISGHTRSGTNLLMRLLDGSPHLLSPPGVGKLHLLRRLSWQRTPSNETPAMRFERLSKDLELQLQGEKLDKFRNALQAAIAKTPSRGFKNDVQIVLETFKIYASLENAELHRWVEKNHNQEFYWSRALQAFSNPRLLLMVRDPRDVWGSWRELCKRENLDTGEAQFVRNIQQHLVEEIIEAGLGVSRFNSQAEIMDYYRVPAQNIDGLNKMVATVLFEGPHTNALNSPIMDVSAFAESDSAAGRFAWNHRIISERGMWLTEAYPEMVAIVGYETLTHHPGQSVQRIADFCNIAVPAEIKPTEIGSSWEGNSSFSSGFQSVSTDSVGRWKQKLNAEEVAAIEAVALTQYEKATASSWLTV